MMQNLPEQGFVHSSPTVRAIDLFCGVGGLTYGLRSAGIEVVLGLDIDASCRYAYEINNQGSTFWECDIRQVNYSDLEPFYGGCDASALVGCAPCQPYSSHTRRNTKPSDRCELVSEFARLIQEGLPDFVFMENVPGLSRHYSFGNLLELLQNLNYFVNCAVLNFHDFGVPQRRKRLVLLASRLESVPLPNPTFLGQSVADLIEHLPPIEAGQTSPMDTAHTTLPLSRTNLRRIRQSKPGGTWKDWDETLVNPCQKRAHYPASYGRMQWEHPAPTITTQFCYYSTGRFGHPVQDRVISVREAALLQTFPKHYELVDPNSDLRVSNLARQVGNAVPVKIGELIGTSIRRVVDDEP